MHKRIVVFISVATLLMLISVAFAHQGHHSPQSQPQTQSIGIPPNPAPSAPVNPQTKSIQQTVEKLPPMRELMMQHLHNKIVHFPIAFGLAGVLFIWLAQRWPQYEGAGKIMWLLGGLASIAAYFTGTAQEEHFEHSFLHRTLEVHERLGISTGLSLIVGFALLMWPEMRKFGRLWAILVLILVAATGFYGGVLAHTE